MQELETKAAELENMARELKNEYQREWAKANRDKRKRYMKTYWERRAERELAERREREQEDKTND